MSRRKGRVAASASKDTLLGRLAFERMLADIAALCANAKATDVVDEIECALGRLVHSLGYDRCTYSEFGPDGSLLVVCSAARGIAPLARGPVSAELPWLVGEIRAGRVVALDQVPDDLPAEATRDRARVARTLLRS